jgi:hypothetical protein
MHVRCTLITADPDRIDSALAYLESDGRSRAESEPGNRGRSLPVAPDLAVAVMESFWVSHDAMRESEHVEAGVRDEVIQPRTGHCRGRALPAGERFEGRARTGRSGCPPHRVPDRPIGPGCRDRRIRGHGCAMADGDGRLRQCDAAGRSPIGTAGQPDRVARYRRLSQEPKCGRGDQSGCRRGNRQRGRGAGRVRPVVSVGSDGMSGSRQAVLIARYQRVPAAARSATESMFDSSTKEGPVSVGRPPPMTSLLVRYSHSESIAR